MMISLWITILVIAIVDCFNYDSYYDSSAWNQSCVPADNISCSVCCAGYSCHSGYFPNQCKNGCIDGHRGGRCYELCTYNCKKCDGRIDICESCFDGFYLGVNKDCKSKCLPTCKDCSSGNSCISCKEGFYNKDGSTDCRYPICTTNCVCNNGECITCKVGLFDINKSCSSRCPDNCFKCSSESQCGLCKDGYYNNNGQTKNCSSSCRDNCTICSSYDECSQCQQGKFGKRCQNICSIGCRDNVCELETGRCNCSNNFSGKSCTDCVSGKYGISCDKNCSDNCKDTVCGKHLGDCTAGCKSETMTGILCDNCVAGRYGLNNCEKFCPKNCLNELCDKVHGTCIEGCKSYFRGPLCLECVQSKYGMKCKNDCPENCKSKECKKISGHCFGCLENFEGEKCDVCKPGYYGSHCVQPCPSKCWNVSCDKDSGKCTYGCEKNYSGDKCCTNNMNCLICNDNTTCHVCVPGFYGNSCNKSCSDLCINNVCELNTGICTAGCNASTNSMFCVRSQGQTQDDNKHVAKDIIIAVLAFTTFASCMSLLVVMIKKRLSTNRRQDESIVLNDLESSKTETQNMSIRETVIGKGQVPYDRLDGDRIDISDHKYDSVNALEMTDEDKAGFETYVNLKI